MLLMFGICTDHGKSLKDFECKTEAWKVLEKGLDPGMKTLRKVLENGM